MRKKILYVITKSVWGGAQKYVYDLATNLSADRFETIVVTGGQGPLTEKLKRAHIRTITLPILQKEGGIFEVLFSFVNIRALSTLIKIFHQEKPDVIHLNSSKIGGLGAIAAFLYKLLTLNFKYLNVVYTVHGWPFNEARPWWQRKIIFFLSWLSTLFQDKVVLINTADYHVALKFLPQRKCTLIFNGIKEINFLLREEARAFLTKKIGQAITHDAVLIGTVAELTKNKGLDHLIDTINQMNFQFSIYNLQTIIIGDGEERKKLQNQINILGLQKTTFLIGTVPNAQQYLKAFDIFVLPSLKEGLPYTIMEAMVAGIPTVATTVGGIPDLITHEKEGLLVPPGNSQALHTTLRQLITNSSLRQKLGINGAKNIKDSFSINRMIQKTTALYEKK